MSGEYGLVPLGAPGTPSSWLYGEYNREKILTSGGNGCKKSASGYWCTTIIVHDGWKISNDYPW